jgi:hypothetical protein
VIANNSDEPTGRLALVFELMEMNMYEHIKGNILNIQTYRKETVFVRIESKDIDVLGDDFN